MFRNLLALLVVLLSFYGETWSAEEKKPLEPVKLILFTWPSPLAVGDAKGFFTEEGIRLEGTITRNSVEQIRGILNGTWDLAQAATDNVIAYDELEGADLAVFASVERGLGMALYVPSSVKSVQDLKGKVMGVDAIASGFTFILRKMLLVNGLDLSRKDYELVAVGGTTQRLQALKEGKIAGALLSVSFEDQAKQAGLVPLIAAREIFDNFLSTSWAGRRTWAAANSDRLVRFLRAYIKSVDWLSDPSNQKEAVAILANRQKISPEVASRLLSQEMDPTTGIITKAAIDVKGLEAVLKLRWEMNLLKTAVPPVEKYYDLTYYNRAVQK